MFLRRKTQESPEAVGGLRHRVLNTDVNEVPDGHKVAYFALGCFWGAERLLWELGVHSTSVGYAGGHTSNPSYREVCTGRSGHAETVRVVFDPAKTPYRDLLGAFWEGHDPTQGMRQGNDIGTQYRSALWVEDDDLFEEAQRSQCAYQGALDAAGRGQITTEVGKMERADYHLAEPEHQQYLDRVPGGYCGLQGTGVTCQL